MSRGTDARFGRQGGRLEPWERRNHTDPTCEDCGTLIHGGDPDQTRHRSCGPDGQQVDGQDTLFGGDG